MHLKGFIYIIIVFFIPLCSCSQKKITDADSPGEKFACLPIKLARKTSQSGVALPVSNLEVIDARADTSKIGFFYSFAALSRMKLCFKNGFDNEIRGFFNYYLQKNFTANSNSLVLAIRKLWVGSYDTLTASKRKIGIQLAFFKAEFYFKSSDCFFPLYRYDSSILFRSDNNEIVESVIEDILITSLSKALNFDYTKLNNSNCISRSSIDSFNLSRINFPVLATQPSKGVYLKLEQFRNNKPAFTEFEIRLDKASDQIFVKGHKGIDSLITNAWGYSDGERFYCRIGYNYFPLFKCGNNFDLYGPKDIILKNPLIRNYQPPTATTVDYGSVSAGLAGLAASELLSMIKTTSIKLKPFQLDLESGKFY